jgi:hypothetical protein
MRLKPMFSYYGSKWRLSPRYSAPKYNLIIEPFAGSANYALFWGLQNSHQLSWIPPLKVKLYDKNKKICELWDYLINVKESEVLNLPLLKPNQKIPENLPKGAKHLMGFWCSKAATSPQKKMAATRRTDLGHWSESIRQRIAIQLQHIRHWTIDQKCYTEIPNQEATWFVDPPYVNGGHHYKHFTIDYNFLAEWCRSRRGQIIVCENGNASWLPFRHLHKTKGLKKDSTEVYWERIQ